jgi:hypothetical protein
VKLQLLFLSSRTTNDWVNPASVGLVVVSSSEGRALPYGKLEDIVSRDAAALNCHTNDDKYVTGIMLDSCGSQEYPSKILV